jgi:hypothetical protein
VSDDAIVAKTTLIQITDDLDGSSSAETYRFAWQGSEYEIDLSKKNFKALDKLLQPYLQAATKLPRRASERRNGSTSRSAARDYAAIRSWAKGQGIDVAERGRVPRSVIAQYDAAH